MDLLNVALSSVGSIIALFALAKLMGNREISQLSMFDYIIGITIGSIAAEMATSLEGDFLKPLLAMVIYALAAVAISFATSKSLKLRRWITGETLVLLSDGKLYRDNMKKARLDLSELLSECRKSGYFNISDIQTALMEPNGTISFLPHSNRRPVNPADLNLSPAPEKPLVNVILDGEVLRDNLKFTGNDELWLEQQLHAQGISKPSDVFLATCDQLNNLSVYIKVQGKLTRDLFE